MTKWPTDNQDALIAFYGNPASKGASGVESQLVKVIPPWQFYYEGKKVPHLWFHRKAAPALQAALKEIWDHVGKSQKEIERLGLSSFGGTINIRKVRGSNTKWSNHAFGAAIDIDPEHNGFNTGHGTMPAFVVTAFKRQGARWGGDYSHRTDPMHFEFCCTQPGGFGLISSAQADEVTAGEDEDPGHVDSHDHDGGDTVPVVEHDNAYPEVPEEKPNLIKSVIASKTSWINWLLGGGAASALANGDNDLQDHILKLVSNPHFLWLIIIIALVGAGTYFYWRDHGKGSQ